MEASSVRQVFQCVAFGLPDPAYDPGYLRRKANAFSVAIRDLLLTRNQD